jgi:kynurenine 3-monooxygenase
MKTVPVNFNLSKFPIGFRHTHYTLDPRLSLKKEQARSINLAISHRGLEAIKAVNPNAAQRFLDSAIPMRGRMIHKKDGLLDSQLYDKDGQVCFYFSYKKGGIDTKSLTKSINSIDRALLNQGLLEDVEACPNVQVFFEHKLQSIDFDNNTLSFSGTTSEPKYFDLCIGADGSFSTVRREMMKVVR